MPSKRSSASGVKKSVARRTYKRQEVKGGPILPNPGGFAPGVARLAGEILRGGARGLSTPHGPDVVPGLSGKVAEVMHGASHAVFGTGSTKPYVPPKPMIAQPAMPKDTSIPAVSIPTPPLYSHPAAKTAYPRSNAYSGHTTRGRAKGGAKPI